MNQEEIDLLTFAIGFLIGKINSKQITIDQLYERLLDEVEHSQPLDGRPHTEAEPAVIELISEFAKRMATHIHQSAWSIERALNLFANFGRLIAEGKLTPTTIAVLTNTSLEEFENHCKVFNDHENNQ